MNFEKHDKIFQTADRLAELLRTSPEYTHYIQARERLLQDPVNRKIFMELRQKQYDWRIACRLTKNLIRNSVLLMI